MLRFIRLCLAVFWLTFLLGSFPILAQTMPSSPQQSVSTSVSLAHLYWHLLMWQNHLDQTATAHERAGKSGAWLRNYLQTRLGFTDDEFGPVRQSAQHLQTQIAILNAQADGIIKQRQDSLSKSESDSLSPDKLSNLTKQREAAINDEIARMNAALGPVNSKRLKDFVQESFAKNVRVITIQPRIQPPVGSDLRSTH